MRRVAWRGGGAMPISSKACSIAMQILAWLSTSVPSQSKMARRGAIIAPIPRKWANAFLPSLSSSYPRRANDPSRSCFAIA